MNLHDDTQLRVFGTIKTAMVEQGRDGPYAVAYVDGEKSSVVIPHAVFEGGDIPNKDDGVWLRDVRWRADKGWYAISASIIRLERRE